MKIYRILCLGAAIVLPQFASAELPFSVQALAQIDGGIDYCSQTNPDAADKYKQVSDLLLKSLPKKDLEAARNSKEYKEARKTVSEDIGKLKKEEAAKTCTELMGPSTE